MKTKWNIKFSSIWLNVNCCASLFILGFSLSVLVFSESRCLGVSWWSGFCSYFCIFCFALFFSFLYAFLWTSEDFQTVVFFWLGLEDFGLCTSAINVTFSCFVAFCLPYITGVIGAAIAC